MRVATPNDPKLSDGGAGHDRCSGKAEESTGHDPRSRSLERLVRRLGLALNTGLRVLEIETASVKAEKDGRFTLQMPHSEVHLRWDAGEDEPEFHVCVAGIGPLGHLSGREIGEPCDVDEARRRVRAAGSMPQRGEGIEC